MVKSRLTIVEFISPVHLDIRGGMNSKRNESMRNVTTIRVFYLYRYVHVITYECRGRNAGNNNVISRTRSRFSFYRSSYDISDIERVTNDIFVAGIYATVVVRLLKTYRFREAESSIINDRFERNSKRLRVSIAFTTDTRPTLRLLARPMRMQSDLR